MLETRSSELQVKKLSIPTTTHGKVLVRAAEHPSAVVVGFHGYMESATIQMDRLLTLPGCERWTLISVQGLHRFYKGRSQDVVAGWMTRQDREQMIADNIEYADRAIEAAAPVHVPLFTAGFSQGVAMAFRAGVRGRRRASGIIAVGGDVPPELLEDGTVEFPAVLLARGETDEWYTAEKQSADVAALTARGSHPLVFLHPGGHDWPVDVSDATARFIQKLSGG